MKNRILHIILSIFCLSLTLLSFGRGARMATEFDGATKSNAYISLDTNILNKVMDKNFSIETWIFLKSRNGDPAIVSNKDWNFGTNKGFVLAVYSDTQIKFNFTTATGTRKDLTVSVPKLIGHWNHIALTVNRGDSIKCYINGKYIKGMATGTGGTASLATKYPINIAEDGTGAYSQGKFIGRLDEFRIWSKELSAKDISNHFCLSLTGNEANLGVYYRFDEKSGTTALDATSNNYNGKYINSVANITSGAFVGDSVQITSNSTNVKYYVPSLGNVELSSPNAGKDDIYFLRILEKPSILSGTSGMDTSIPHFSVFYGGRNTLNYSIIWDYKKYSKSIANKSKLLLFQRSGNDDSLWVSNLLDTKDTSKSTITSKYKSDQNEYFIGNFFSTVCNTPSKIDTVSTSYKSVVLSFKSGGSSLLNIEFGTKGFTKGKGSIISGVSASSNYNLSGLSPSTSYNIYIQDTCVGSGTSKWFGPFNVATKIKTMYKKPGSGNTIKFTSTGKEYISLGKNSAFKIKKNITLEMWVKMDDKTDWVGLASYAQDNLTNESGYYMGYYNGKLRFFIRASGLKANDWNTNPGADVNVGEWNHVAGTYDGDTIKFYLNGQLVDSRATSGDILWTYAPLDFRIGMFYDDNEQTYSDSRIDEVRLWNIARTQAEIRASMCKKLTGNETGLVTYHNFDEGSGSKINDLSPNELNGDLYNTTSSSWEYSGAAIGNVSLNSYPSSWSGKNIKLSSLNNGFVNISSVTSSNLVGIQLYQINDKPNIVNGISDTAYSNPYFGVFICGDKSATYSLTYDYANFSYAKSNNKTLNIYNRANNSTILWNNLSGTNDKTNFNVLKTNQSGQKEFVLNGFTPSKCVGPDSLTFKVKGTDILISWKSTASNHNIEFGKSGYSFGKGTKITKISKNNYLLSGLKFETDYDLYVQDSCGATDGNSPWVGPLKFKSPTSCIAPDSVWIDSLYPTYATVKWKSSSKSNKFQLIYGTKGFDPTFGFLKTGSNGKYVITGLTKQTQYDVYIRTNCDSNFSSYIGPITFKTPLNVGIEDHISTSINDFFVYPNPTTDIVYIQGMVQNIEEVNIQLLDLTGKILENKILPSRNGMVSTNFNTAYLPKGMYIIQLIGGSQKTQTKLIK